MLGMSSDTFRRLSPAAMAACIEAYEKHRRGEQTLAWDKVRTLGALLLQPHTTKRVTPQMLIPLEDIDGCRRGRREVSAPAAPVSTRARVDELMGRCQDQGSRGLEPLSLDIR